MNEYNENYEEIYGKYDKIELVQCGTEKKPAYRKATVRTEMDYKNKFVLDIGADYGSTADFFLKKGAYRVIAVEKDPEYYKGLSLFSEGRPITPLHIEIKTIKDILDLIVKYKPDIVKIDCEGCERNFLRHFYTEKNKKKLMIPEFFIIEIHPNLGTPWHFTSGINIADSVLVVFPIYLFVVLIVFVHFLTSYLSFSLSIFSCMSLKSK